MTKRIIPAAFVAIAAIMFAAPASAQSSCALRDGGKTLVSLVANGKTAMTADGRGDRAPVNPATLLLAKDGGGLQKLSNGSVKVSDPQNSSAGGAAHFEQEA